MCRSLHPLGSSSSVLDRGAGVDVFGVRTRTIEVPAVPVPKATSPGLFGSLVGSFVDRTVQYRPDRTVGLSRRAAVIDYTLEMIPEKGKDSR